MRLKLFALLFLLNCYAGAGEFENELRRQSGFAEHNLKNKKWDQSREKNYDQYLEEIGYWEQQRRKAQQEYKSKRKMTLPEEQTLEYKEYLNRKNKELFDYEKARQLYVMQKKSIKKPNVITEEEELGLDRKRPRFDFKKRAHLEYKSKGGSGSSGSGFGGGSRVDDGYIPPPSFEDVNTEPPDFPPPPPPPPPPFPGSDFDSEIPPPPPPPPLDDIDGF